MSSNNIVHVFEFTTTTAADAAARRLRDEGFLFAGVGQGVYLSGFQVGVIRVDPTELNVVKSIVRNFGATNYETHER